MAAATCADAPDPAPDAATDAVLDDPLVADEPELDGLFDPELLQPLTVTAATAAAATSDHVFARVLTCISLP